MFFFLPLKLNRHYSTLPLFTLALIVINIIVFAGTVENIHLAALEFGFRLDSAAWYTWLTSLFLHGSWSHLIFNLYFLWIFGSFLEDTIGRMRYLLLYFFGGLVSALSNSFVFWLFFPEWTRIPLIGASGAIAALMGLFAVRFLYHKIRVAYFIFVFYFIRWGTFELSSMAALLLWFAREIFYGYFQLKGLNTGVANWAHIGGFVFGLVWAKLSKYEKKALHEHYLDEARSLRKKDFDLPALAQYKEALKMDPANLEVMAEMAPLLAEAGEENKARLFYELAINKMLEVGKREEALKLYLEAEEKIQDEADLELNLKEKYTLACAAEAKNYTELAEKLYRQVLSSNDATFKEMAHFRLGEILRKSGKTKEAISVFQSFLENFPRSEWLSLVEERLGMLVKPNNL